MLRHQFQVSQPPHVKTPDLMLIFLLLGPYMSDEMYPDAELDHPADCWLVKFTLMFEFTFIQTVSPQAFACTEQGL